MAARPPARSTHIARATTATRQLRDRIVALVVVTIGLDLICAGLTFGYEHHAKPTQIQSYGSALFWTSTQLLTVSSQIQNPLTVPDRILDVVMKA